MVLANRDEPPTWGPPVVSQWAAQLRIACVALVDTPPRVIKMIRVIIALGGSPAKARLLELLAKRFAEEYDLQVQIEINQDSVRVRFSHRGN